MKKQLTLLFVTCFLVSNVTHAQKAFENKLTVDYTASVVSDFSSFGSNLMQAARSRIDNNVNLNYKLGRKVSLELRGGLNTIHRNEFTMREASYGVGLNFFFSNSYAPLGNSFGVYYQSNNFLPTDYNEFYAFLSYPSVNYYETTTQINYKVDVIGFQFNFVSMLSNRAPVYFKYGFNLCIPAKKQIFDASFKKSSFETYGVSREFGSLYDGDLLNQLSTSTIFALNVGIGYLF